MDFDQLVVGPFGSAAGIGEFDLTYDPFGRVTSADSDEPTWIAEGEGESGTVKRYVSDFEGALAMETTTTGGRLLQLVDLHGDVIARLPIGDGEGQARWAGLVFAKFDEFGQSVSLGSIDLEGRAPARYGWLGGPQRSAEALGSLVLMGARLYDPASGRFLSVDPVPGGSASAYDYCNGDPVNCTDLNGLWGFKKPKWLTWDNVAKVTAIAGAAACIVASAGACTAIAVAGVAVSVGSNVSKAIKGDLSWKAAAGNIAIDGVLAFARPARAVLGGAGSIARRAAAPSSAKLIKSLPTVFARNVGPRSMRYSVSQSAKYSLKINQTVWRTRPGRALFNTGLQIGIATRSLGGGLAFRAKKR